MDGNHRETVPIPIRGSMSVEVSEFDRSLIGVVSELYRSYIGVTSELDRSCIMLYLCTEISSRTISYVLCYIERFDLKRETHPKKKYLCTLFITVPL